MRVRMIPDAPTEKLMHSPARSAAADAVLVIFAFLYLVVGGVTLMQGLVNYPFWRDMGPMMSNEDFLRLRQAHYWKIYPLAVYPGFAALLLNVALLFLRPAGVTAWLTVTVLVLSLGVGIATFAVEIPFQDVLDARGYDRAAIEGLIRSDLIYRKIAGVAGMLVVALMLWQALRCRSTTPARVPR
jgi:hypothetical protein